MNIFVLDKSPEIAAQMLCDTHLSGMVKESAQMLACCFSLERLAQPDCPRTQKGTPRKHGYYNHPCTKWSRETVANMQWLVDHAIGMAEEREFRQMPRHFSSDFIEWCDANLAESLVPFGQLTDFPIAINDSMNCRKIPDFANKDRVTQYQLYYKMDKPFAGWTRRSVPKWFDTQLEAVV